MAETSYNCSGCDFLVTAREGDETPSLCPCCGRSKNWVPENSQEIVERQE